MKGKSSWSSHRAENGACSQQPDWKNSSFMRPWVESWGRSCLGHRESLFLARALLCTSLTNHKSKTWKESNCIQVTKLYPQTNTKNIYRNMKICSTLEDTIKLCPASNQILPGRQIGRKTWPIISTINQSIKLPKQILEYVDGRHENNYYNYISYVQKVKQPYARCKNDPNSNF